MSELLGPPSIQTNTEVASPAIPTPRRERWQPLRSGVLNLYRYDYEEFHYEDGRLLLRGNNGSGKSRVLALQLPFLLDGEVSPARVEPDGDPAKRIEWNLLMGRYPDRTGYTWIEFGRRDPDGTAHYLTLGCGLRAVAGHTGLHSRWFFLTSLRPGRDFFLQTAQRTPLSRDRLAELLGPAGRIFLKAEEYRRAVDDALFGLGPRYGALIELLLRLRRPQLSRKLEEAELSQALSDALATLPATIIDEVAESFRSLEADRETLREYTLARAAVESFLTEYNVYVRIAVRRRAANVRSAHSAYEHAQRAFRDAASRWQAADDALRSLVRQQEELQVELSGAEARVQTLQASPEMRTAEEVKQAAARAEQMEQLLAQADADLRRATDSARQMQDQLASTESRHREVAEQLEAGRRHAADAAQRAALTEDHRRHLPPDTPIDEVRARPALERVLERRAKAVAALQQREAAVAHAAQALARADEERQEADDAASAAREAEHAARAGLEAAAESLLIAYTAWQRSLRELRAPAPDAFSEYDDWVERRDGPSPLGLAVQAAWQDALRRSTIEKTRLEQERRDLEAVLAELDQTIQRLEQGETAPPPPPLTRRTDRSGRPGAPLWRLCDFRPEVSDEKRAGLEAALQAAGLLDAWLSPDGRLWTQAEDTFLLAEATGPGAPATSLLDVLVVAIDSRDPAAAAVSPAHVQRVLSQIGHGTDTGLHWVSDTGEWRLGPARGRWVKPVAEYIGETTRAIARRQQLAEAHRQRDQRQAERAAVEAALSANQLALEAARAEQAAAPSDEPVRRAGYDLEQAARRVGESVLASERAARLAAQRRTEWEERTRERDEDAADLHLSAWLSKLSELERLTHDYARILAELWPTARHGLSTQLQLVTQREHAAAAHRTAEELRARREATAQHTAAARQRYDTLQATHGQAIVEILAQLRRAEAEVSRLKERARDNQTAQLTQTDARSRAESDRAHAEELRTQHERERQQAILRLQQLAEQRLLAQADPTLGEIDPHDWSATEGVEIARRIEQLLVSTPDGEADWQKRQDAIHGHIQDLRDRLIAHGHSPETHQVDELVLVQCVFQGRSHTMGELAQAFVAEVLERERILQAQEREIIENHLLAEVAVELQKLIRAAENWRISANDELSSRPTSSGVRFRFQWEPDAETGFQPIRPILLRKGELWTPTERTALAAFLQGRIDAEKASDQTGSWRDHLARALDYRRWHRFIVERQQDGQWRRLDRTTYGTGSGGEKALALTLPRFAAAAAHYRSAAPTAPRLVMLDEAFAGIDPTMRGQCMGVLTQFDLDVVMTSELEWGCYPTVPALAIYHLTTLPGLDAVGATRWLWNGRQKRRDTTPPPPEAPPAEEPADPAPTPRRDDESLLG